MSVLVSPAAGTARAATDRTDEPQADFCRPFLCNLGTRPHDHCACGLPMLFGAEFCDQCRREGVEPRLLRRPQSAEEWNGRSYPSRRQHRCGTPHPDGHLKLLLTILAPATEEGTRA